MSVNIKVNRYGPIIYTLYIMKTRRLGGKKNGCVYT